jgi:hypothetical protein
VGGQSADERRAWIARLLQAVESLMQDNPSRHRKLIEDIEALKERLERELRDERAPDS